MTTSTSADTSADSGTGAAEDGRPGGAPPPQRTAWLAAGVTLTVVGILAASLNVLSWLAERVTVEQHTYPAAGVSRVEVASGRGDVRVVRGSGGRVTVERRVHWSYVHPRLTERVEGGTLHVGSRCALLSGFRCGTDYVIQVPDGVSVFAWASSGDVSVHDVTGQVALRTSSGDVTVGDVVGDVDAVLSSGDLRVDDVRGRVSAATSSGDVTLTGLRSSDVDVRASSGDIRLEFAEAPDAVSVQASSGDVDVAVPARDPYRVRVVTSSGDENVDVVQDPAAPRSIRVDVSSGDVRIRYLGT